MSAPRVDLNPFTIAENVIKETGRGVGNIGAEVSKGINDISREVGRGIPQVTGAIGAGADRILKMPGQGLQNAERNISGVFNDLGYGIQTGDYTSFFNRAGALALPIGPGGSPVGLFANPDDVTRATGTKSGAEKVKDKTEQAKARAIAAETNRQEEQRLSGIRQYVESTIDTRTRRPGRALTLLGQEGQTGGTLLTRR